ncbi:Mbov_0121 family peptidase domain-containing ABC transporter [Mycoplasma seminis]|uniref:ATP-binding cassette domain-containing protein n=1 Tax=Mycoplasma seminis TaxID=512749 RepID=A0ABY9HAV8_9MOLU|nr:ATP-binding cassette domain-containing protein [Mycoplasma seminis]WLP85732.1 ATP-binding cassette domain-containing protein [Mycoplasma seminis]
MKRKQFDIRDCSLYVLKWFYDKYHINAVDINELKLNAKYSENGIAIPDFEFLCLNYGIQIEVFNCQPQELYQLDKDIFPIGCIIKNNENTHMVVIKKITNNAVIIYDPARGNLKYSKKEFDEVFLSLLIKFSKKETNVFANKTKASNGLMHFDKFSLFYFIVLICETLILFSIPYFNKIILEKVIPNKLNIHLLYLGVIFVFLILLNFTLKSLSEKIISTIFIRRKENILFNFLKDLKIKNQKRINKLNVLEMKNRINAFDNIINFEITFLPEILSMLITFLLSFILLWKINLYLMIIVLVYSAITLIVSFINKSIYDKKLPILMQKGLVTDNSFENFFWNANNFTNIYLEEKLIKDLIHNYEDIHNEILNFKSKNIVISSFAQTLDIIAPLCVLIVGSYQVWNNSLSTINLIFFLTGASLFTKPIKNIIPLLSSLHEYQKSKTLLKIFNLDSEEILWSQQISCKIQNIKINTLSYSYTASKLNKALNVPRITIANKVHLTGSNGCGKSTLGGILAGYLQADSGEILINDKKIDPFLDKTYKQKVAYIGKSNQLNISVLDFLCISNIEQFYDFINTLELNECLKHLNISLSSNLFLSNLSSGQRQFISLLSLFLVEYDVIILDEAFENLDLYTFNILKNKLQMVLKNSIVVEISHNNKYVFEKSEVINLETISA